MENKVEYRKDMCCTYLDIWTDSQHPGEAYELKLLQKIQVPGLTAFYSTEADMETKYVYRLNKYTALEYWIKEQPLDADMIRRILRSVIRVMESVDEYLLDPDNLVLEDTYIFLNEQDYYASFVYLPGYKVPFWEQMRLFSEKWLNEVAYEEKEAVFLVYQFYKKVHEPHCVLEVFREMLDEGDLDQETEADMEKGAGQEDVRVENQLDKEWRGYAPKIILYMCIPVIVGLACLILKLRIVPWHAGMITGMVEVLGTIIILVGRKQREKNAKAIKKIRDRKKDDFYKMDLEDTDVPPEGEPWELIPIRKDCCPEIHISYWPFVIGKVPSEVDYVLDKPRVSHIHARFDRLGWGMTVADMDSSNGTYLNGEKLIPGREYAVNPDDRIRFADVDFICRSKAESTKGQPFRGREGS